MRPNYVRVFCNKGMAFANTTDYQSAAGSYLNALALNPDAKHLWNYLRTALIKLGKFDMLPLVDQQQVDAFRD